MGLLNGSLTLQRFIALGPVPNSDKIAEMLEKNCFTPFEGGSEDMRHGFVDWRNPLITKCDKDWLFQDRYAVFQLRIDTRKIPASLLKAHLDLKIEQVKKQHDLAFVSKDLKTELQDEIKDTLLPKITPSMKCFDIAWDLKKGMIWTTASNKNAKDTLIELFIQMFNIELQSLNPVYLAASLTPEIPEEYFRKINPTLEITCDVLANEFITYLWMCGHTINGASGIDADTSVCFLDQSINLFSERGEVQEITLKKGNPTESVPAFQALSEGMYPTQAKVRLMSGDLEWTFNLKADGLKISGLKLPPTKSKDLISILSNRLFSLEECTTLIDNRFAQYLRRRHKDEDKLALETEKWIKENLSQDEQNQ